MNMINEHFYFINDGKSPTEVNKVNKQNNICLKL